MTWNPTQYLQYEDARLRPALELLARVPLAAPATIVDLGCGAGNVARSLAQRWPQAAITGIDSDEAMLAKARAAAGGLNIAFECADVDGWRAAEPFDLVYSNAALHWLDDHAMLFPRLAQSVAPGGVLAVQMPDNFRAPSHTLLHETAALPRWRERLARLVRPSPVARPQDYFAWLAPHFSAIDAWTTEYLQHLPGRTDGEHPVLAWMRGTALLPFMNALDESAQREFATGLSEHLTTAYPPRADGSVLFPFRRLFVVARR